MRRGLGALALLAACGGVGKSNARFDTSGLWPVTEGRFQAYRYAAAGSDPSSDTGTLPEEMLMADIERGGCSDGAGWSMELRLGSSWAEGAAQGALEWSDADGLALCALTDADGAASSFDPMITLWTAGQSLADGESASSGDWTSTATFLGSAVTYYGVFDGAMAFDLSGGSGDPDGWRFTFAPIGGLVVIESPDATADLVYFR